MMLPYRVGFHIDSESRKTLFLNNYDYEQKGEYKYEIKFSSEDLKRYRAYFTVCDSNEIHFHKIFIEVKYNCSEIKKFVEKVKEMLKNKRINATYICCCKVEFSEGNFTKELSERFNDFICKEGRIPSEREVKSLILEQLASYPSEEQLLEKLREELDKYLAQMI